MKRNGHPSQPPAAPHPDLHRIVRYITAGGWDERARVEAIDDQNRATLRILGEPIPQVPRTSIPYSEKPRRGCWSRMGGAKP